VLTLPHHSSRTSARHPVHTGGRHYGVPRHPVHTVPRPALSYPHSF
jgi:hypothetical protein